MAKRYGFRGRTVRTMVGLCCGIVFGLFFGLYTQDSVLECSQQYGVAYELQAKDVVLQTRLQTWTKLYDKRDIWSENGSQIMHPVEGYPSSQSQASSGGKKLVLIGVMTAAKYLKSRAIASIETWARSIPGKVLYFSSEGSEKLVPPGFPVIGLKGVDDTYPPQKKSFLMLKYMYEYYGNSFEWFMRVDDDIYVKGDKLEAFLRSINSSIPQFIGQAGLGNQAEFGMLNLDKKENYCMGGPGMVFSASTLKGMVPHISYCLKNLYTTHEDVEIGRCVSRFAEASCTWAYEMQRLFYHNHKDANGSFAAPLKTSDIDRAITLHPVKNHTYQYRIHAHFHAMRSQALRHRSVLLHRQIHEMDELLQDRDQFYSPNRLGLRPTLTKFVPKSREEVITWDFITKSLYTYKNLNPRPGLDVSSKAALDDVVRQVMESINLNARQRGRTIDFKDLLYGYKRVDPLHGANYVLDLLLVYRKHKGRKMTIPVRRHAYLQQAFSEIEFREDSYTEEISAVSGIVDAHAQDATPTRFVDYFQKPLSMFNFNSNQPKSNAKQQSGGALQTHVSYDDKVLYFILTLSGRFEKFQSFMRNFEEVVLKREKQAVLSVMLFKHETEDRTSDMHAYTALLQRQYPQHSLQVVPVDGPFSRGLGLEKGSLLHGPEALLVFIDVDMYLHEDSLLRVKLNTMQGKQVYFPIVFSQFDPATYCNATCRVKNTYPTPFHYSDVDGYWRMFGFGIASMYNSDFQAMGGFDKDIEGWGSEDVKLYETFVKQNFSLFRAAELGLVHIFHPINCDSSLESSQYRMCLGTKASTFASVIKLADMVYQNDAIFHRNEENKPQKNSINSEPGAGEVRPDRKNMGAPYYAIQKQQGPQNNGLIPQIRKPGS